MRELAILTFVTLDGVMQSPSSPEEDPSGGFVHGGWARGCWDDVISQVVTEAISIPYDLLHDLIDEFRLWTFPVAVGSGKRLFESGTVPTELLLKEISAGPSGAIMSIYRRQPHS